MVRLRDEIPDDEDPDDDVEHRVRCARLFCVPAVDGSVSADSPALRAALEEGLDAFERVLDRSGRRQRFERLADRLRRAHGGP